jgi:hypothetical protein
MTFSLRGRLTAPHTASTSTNADTGGRTTPRDPHRLTPSRTTNRTTSRGSAWPAQVGSHGRRVRGWSRTWRNRSGLDLIGMVAWIGPSAAVEADSKRATRVNRAAAERRLAGPGLAPSCPLMTAGCCTWIARGTTRLSGRPDCCQAGDGRAVTSSAGPPTWSTCWLVSANRSRAG